MSGNLAIKPLTESKPLKAKVERETLLKALAHMQSVVERRNTIPILSNVLISADTQGILLSTTDMDIELVEQIEAKVDVVGATTVSALMLYDIVRKLPEGSDVEIDNTDNDGRLTVKSGRSKFNVATLPIEDFPSSSQSSYSHSFAIESSELKRLIDRARFAISTEETRYYLNGIFFHAADNKGVKVLRAVSTDGHRLARIEVPLPEGAGDMPGIIIPRKAVLEARKLIDEYPGAVSIALSETRIRFTFDSVVLSSKLIDGTFPDYQRVIPEGNDKHLEVDTKSLAQAADRVSTISTEKSRAVKFSVMENSLTLSANSPETGTATEELEVAYKGTSLAIGFNSRYLLDCLQQVEGETTQVLLADPASPAIIQDVADKSALYVLMPMRV